MHAAPDVRQTPSDAPRPDMTPLQQSVGRTHGFEPARVEGVVPDTLRGTLIRTGPGLLERFGRRLAHTFEADGALSAVRFGATTERAVQLVRSPGFEEEEAAGKPLYGSAAPRWRRWLNGTRGRTKTTGNTNVMQWQGRTFALMEGGRPIEVDARTLGTGAVEDFCGVLGSAFSAHPHRLDATKTTYNFGQIWGRVPALRLYAMPDEGAVRVLGEVTMPFNTMVHDFAVTPRYAVFVVCPAKLDLRRALTASAAFDKYFVWNDGAPAELIVVPLQRPDAAVHIEIDGRWVFHLANAFERGDELVVDWVQYPDFRVFTALSGHDPETDVGASRVQRLTIDPLHGGGRLVREEVLWDHRCDFPVLVPEQVGHAYGPCWYACGEPRVGGGVARLDTRTGDTDVWQPGPGHTPSEAVFVRRPDAVRPDEGWLLSLVYDGWARESFVAILDADRPAQGPIAKVWMGQSIPLTFHGTFVPA